MAGSWPTTRSGWRSRRRSTASQTELPGDRYAPLPLHGSGAYRTVEGLVVRYEPGAVLEFPPGRTATGTDQIRQVYRELLAGRPRFEPGEQMAALVNGELALTSTRLVGGGATAEVARRQPDGTWLWAIDQPTLPS